MRPVILMLAMLAAVNPEPVEPAEPATGAGGEALHYRVEWRFIRAGTVRLEMDRAGSGWQARLALQSSGPVSLLYRVDDLYQAEMNGDYCALASLMKAHEGSRQRETRVTYDSARGKASYLERDLKRDAEVASHEIDIPPCVHDVVGGLYQLRRLRIETGKSAAIPVSDGKKSVMARVEAQRVETVDTPAGRYRAVRYEVFLFNNVLYRRNGRLYVWLTDDDRRLPVQIRARMQLHIGTITLQLEKVEAT